MKVLLSWWNNHKTDMRAVREDARKFGMAIIIAGYAGYFMNKISGVSVLYLLVVGLIVWVFGIRNSAEK